MADQSVILLVLDGNRDNLILKSFLYANGEALMQHNGNHTADKYFYLHDRLSSVRMLIDTAGLVKNNYTYKPFGELLDSSQTVSNPFLFTGQWFDPEIGQYYLRARQYDPQLFRFTARDPVFGKLEEPLTLHKYLYCWNDPINKIDPWGQDAYYLKGDFLASAGLSYSACMGITWDDQGNWGLIGTEAQGIGSASLSVGFTLGITSAETILDLKGYGWSSGGTFSPGFFGGGASYVWSEKYRGIELNVGVGVPFPMVPGEIHPILRTNTYIYTMGSQTLTFEQIVGQSASAAFWQCNAAYEYMTVLHFMAITNVDYDVLF